MHDIKVGDIVTRASYGNDIYFRVCEIVKQGDTNLCKLVGIDYRIIADAPVSDIIAKSEKEIAEHKSKMCRMVNFKHNI
ncbi:MAG: sporulation peptidase YabG [Bacillota bacterium]|nr:sporulation peptidase YabG [Bacillota bacterium]